jgi:hypothetical protein
MCSAGQRYFCFTVTLLHQDSIEHLPVAAVGFVPIRTPGEEGGNTALHGGYETD